MVLSLRNVIGLEKRNEGVYDLAVVGGGPKGLSTHMAALGRRMNSVLLDASAPKKTQWGNSDQLKLMHPPQVDITENEGLSYQKFLREDPDGLVSMHGPLVNGEYSHALHFHSYLLWLRTRLKNISSDFKVTNIERKDGVYLLNGFLRARNLVFTTGMRGLGGQEFMFDPSGLLHRSSRVTHSPGITETGKSFETFLKGRKSVMLVGSSATTFAALEQLDEIKYKGQVSIISDQDDIFGQLRAELSRRRQPQSFFDRLNLSGVNLLPNRKVNGGEDRADCVRLFTSDGHYDVDACVLTTGFHVRASDVPLFRDVKGVEFKFTEEGRHLDLDSGFQVKTTDGSESGVFVHGHAAHHLDTEQSWLSCTSATVNRVLSQISASPESMGASGHLLASQFPVQNCRT